jgi:hypothetical protein
VKVVFLPLGIFSSDVRSLSLMAAFNEIAPNRWTERGNTCDRTRPQH